MSSFSVGESIVRSSSRFFSQGALTQLWAGTMPEAEGASGQVSPLSALAASDI